MQAEGTVSLQCADGNAIVGSHLWIPEGREREGVCLQIIFNNWGREGGRPGGVELDLIQDNGTDA